MQLPGITFQNDSNLQDMKCTHAVTILSIALQPFVGPWPLFQFDLLHSQ
jgi:hypothetical protein